jgi:hypothetical protein
MLPSRLSVNDEERAYLATLRPTHPRGPGRRRRLDVRRSHRSRATEAVALRGVLELFGVRVRHFPVGHARHLVGALGGDATAPYVVLACHGDEGRILLSELADEIERFQPVLGSLGPDELRRVVQLPGSAVIGTGCHTGTPELAGALFEGGASAYVAPDGAPFGYASAFAPLLPSYELTKGRSLEQAGERLRTHDRELSMWRLFLPSGAIGAPRRTPPRPRLQTPPKLTGAKSRSIPAPGVLTCAARREALSQPGLAISMFDMSKRSAPRTLTITMTTSSHAGHRATAPGAFMYTRSSAISEVLLQCEHRTSAIVMSSPKWSSRAPAIAFPSSASMAPLHSSVHAPVGPKRSVLTRRESCPFPTSDCAVVSTNPVGPQI